MPLPAYIQFARELRKNQTPEEKIIWERVRARQLKGYKFLRQHPIVLSSLGGMKQFYIADFYCAEKRLVVEIDGSIHLLQGDYDEARDYLMSEMGLQILRIKNREVRENTEALIKRIEKYLL